MDVLLIPLGLIPFDTVGRENVSTRFLRETSGFHLGLSYNATPQEYYDWLNRPEPIFPEYQSICYPDIGSRTPICIRSGKLHFGPGISTVGSDGPLLIDDPEDVERQRDHYRRLAHDRLQLLMVSKDRQR
jgi:hypothetical protein